jgi:Tetracyclin repressor-like, C-terminal domain
VDETVASFVDFMSDNRDTIHVMVQEGITPETSPQFAECERRVDEMFGASIKLGVEAGVFRVSDPELMGRLLHHALDGTVAHSIMYEGDLDRDRLIGGARELVRKALSP